MITTKFLSVIIGCLMEFATLTRTATSRMEKRKSMTGLWEMSKTLISTPPSKEKYSSC